MRKAKCTAVILAAGNGSRMKSSVAKQFLELAGKPLIFYALQAVEQSNIIEECILVTGPADAGWVKEKIVDRFGFRKVRAIVPGGSERCFSVANAMKSLGERGNTPGEEYIFIHDGARPFLTEEILERTYLAAVEWKACVAAMPSKDTVKLADAEGFASHTPERKRVWTVQTPQVFERELITGAYAKLLEAAAGDEGVFVTDDASVVERFTNVKVRLVEGSYSNLKITTPEDMVIAEALLKARRESTAGAAELLQ